MSMLRNILITLLAIHTFGCGPSEGERAVQTIERDYVPRIGEIIRADTEQHMEGLAEATEMVAPGFSLEAGAHQTEQMRRALKRIRRARGGVRSLVATAMSFLAAVDREGVCIARDKTPDLMQGQNYGEMFPMVRRALEAGEAASGPVAFPAQEEGEAHWAILFVQPVRHEGVVVGALMGGIPYTRLSTRISRQLQVEHTEEVSRGMAVWAYLYKGAQVFQFGVPPDLESLVPSPERRRSLLSSSPAGAGEEGFVYGRSYGVFVRPEAALGSDAGVVIVRGEPMAD